MFDKDTDRPLVTFALFAYNQEGYIREAVEGAFAQTYEPLEIILSDDCSSDRTFEIMKEMAAAYKGPHEVRVRKNETNLGVANHFDTVMRNANGDLVLVAAGDDISHPERAEACVNLAIGVSDLGLIEVSCKNFTSEFDPASNLIEIHAKALPDIKIFSINDVLDERMKGLVGAGRAYFRNVYTKYQPFAEGCPSEDTPALFRCLHQKKGAFINRALVARRIHEENLSNLQSLSKMNFHLLAQQYILDLQQARTLGLLDDILYAQRKAEFQKYSFRKQCAVDVHDGFRKGIRFLDVLNSDCFSFRDKAYLVRKGIASRLRKNG